MCAFIHPKRALAHIFCYLAPHTSVVICLCTLMCVCVHTHKACVNSHFMLPCRRNAPCSSALTHSQLSCIHNSDTFTTLAYFLLPRRRNAPCSSILTCPECLLSTWHPADPSGVCEDVSLLILTECALRLECLLSTWHQIDSKGVCVCVCVCVWGCNTAC